MSFKLIFIAVIITVGFFVVSSGLGGGNVIYTFLASFGLFMIIIFVGLLLFAKKNKDK